MEKRKKTNIPDWSDTPAKQRPFFEEASGHGGALSISGHSLRLRYLYAGLETPNLLSVITPFTGIDSPTQHRECLINREGEKVRMWRWLSAAAASRRG